MFWNFSSRIVQYPDQPRLEILINDKPWSEGSGYRSDLKLTRNDAAAALAASPVLEDFVNSKGAQPPDREVVERCPSDDEEESIPGLPDVVLVKEASFIIEGQLMERPVLWITSNKSKKGYGPGRAEALLFLEDELRAFVKSPRSHAV